MENKQWLVINYSFEVNVSGSLLTPPPRHSEDTYFSFHLNNYQMTLQRLAIIRKLVNTDEEISSQMKLWTKLKKKKNRGGAGAG